jgi:hypothetical protein
MSDKEWGCEGDEDMVNDRVWLDVKLSSTFDHRSI